jgi:uncharacterized protein YndB with AHSA1/START domain
MRKYFKISGATVIAAGTGKVWDVVTNPDKIKLYTGSQTITDWKVGSPVLWRGELQGQKYEDKGKVLENNRESLLKFEYWSSFGGYEDKPENYSVITYAIDKLSESETRFTYTREKIPSGEEARMFESHLPMMLEAIKGLAEERQDR